MDQEQERIDRIVTAQLEGAENRQQHCLDIGTLFGAVAVRSLSGHDGRPDLPFGMVVVSGHPRVIEESEYFIAVAIQTLSEPVRTQEPP